MKLADARSVYLDPDYRDGPGKCNPNDPSPLNWYFCIRCERKINPNRPHRDVWVLPDGGVDSEGNLWPDVFHPDDAPLIEGESLDRWPIGMDCAKKIGMGYTIDPDFEAWSKRYAASRSQT